MKAVGILEANSHLGKMEKREAPFEESSEEEGKKAPPFEQPNPRGAARLQIEAQPLLLVCSTPLIN